ncbi:MAG TPA: hypothetical protein VFJ85_14810 [Acidimicrobiales bacterium]|nr:hypothetical protein [Acidimicrobiales bacterium]
MDSRRWTNPGQPQTLQIAVFLLYANAVFLLFDMLRYSVITVLGLAVLVGLVGGAFGIANERKWGYLLGVVMAFSPFLFRWYYRGLSHVFSTDLLQLMFEVALVALLLHPQSRDYQRIWFK